MAATGRLAASIAHEINNPLEAITNLLYLVADRVKDDKIAADFIASAERELQRISGITKQTLLWSKDNFHKSEYGSAGSLFKDVMQVFAGKIRNRDVNLVIEGGEDILFYGTVGQIGQVMANLVSNAIQAVQFGGKIWLNATTDGKVMEISVRDDGHGMSDETRRNLFQPFYSTRGDIGNGLGLYISREIVERNGGSMAVTSHLGMGTEMRVRLPARPPAEDSTAT